MKTSGAIGIVFKVAGGVEEEIPDVEIFEFIKIGFDGIFANEFLVEVIKSGEDIETGSSLGVAMKDGAVIFEITVERFVDDGKIICIKD